MGLGIHGGVLLKLIYCTLSGLAFADARDA